MTIKYDKITLPLLRKELFMIYVALFIQNDSVSHSEESIIARALLSDLYKKVFGEKIPEIKKCKLGKPYFDFQDAPPFSISHSDGAVAVALSNEKGEVGIDIQSKIDEEKRARISRRFPFVKERVFKELSDVCFFKATLNSGNFSFEEFSESPCQKSDFTLYWTSTEAILKAEGGGFTSAKKLDELEKTHEVSSFLIGDFYISITKQTEICK